MANEDPFSLPRMPMKLIDVEIPLFLCMEEGERVADSALVLPLSTPLSWAIVSVGGG